MTLELIDLSYWLDEDSIHLSSVLNPFLIRMQNIKLEEGKFPSESLYRRKKIT